MIASIAIALLLAENVRFCGTYESALRQTKEYCSSGHYDLVPDKPFVIRNIDDRDHPIAGRLQELTIDVDGKEKIRIEFED